MPPGYCPARGGLPWHTNEHRPVGKNGAMAYEFDRSQRIVILGGGPGGYEAALSGARLGAEVTLVERSGVGGSAVLTDVVPSKSLIATAAAAGSIAQAAELGVQFYAEGVTSSPVIPRVAINLAAVNRRLLALAEAQSVDMRDNLRAAGVTIIAGEGRLDGANRVIVSTGGVDFQTLPADTIVVAVGARPRVLDTAVPDGERILTWTQLYQLQTVPEHLIVVGSGVTGAEFASAYLALGAKVTLVSSRETVLPGEDQDAAALIDAVFRRNGMQVVPRSRAESVTRTPDGVRVTLAGGEVIEGSHCLMAVGSVPNTENIGLAEAGIELDATGHIKVNRVARTSVPNIYAAGDCTTYVPLASVASMQGRTAVFHALGDIVNPPEERNITSNVFTYPEIATVGRSQRDIEEGIVAGSVYRVDLSHNPRAKMMGISEGFVKLVASAGAGTILGGVIVAPGASELIFAVAQAVTNRRTVDQLAQTFPVYPSLMGSVADAARAMHIRGGSKP